MKTILNQVDNRSPEEIKENKKRIDRMNASNEGKTLACEICGKQFLPSELRETDDNENVCEECFKTEECEYCNKRFKKDEIHQLVNLSGTVDCEHVCEECRDTAECEADPEATVLYNGDEEPHYITAYRDDTEGDFITKYVRTDGWRGYFDVEPSENSDFVHAHSDQILSYSADAEELKKFDDEFQEALRNMGIKYARVFTRTSNVFCTGYDFFVDKNKILEAGAIRVMLALKYRDPERFNSTCLTGADPEDQTEHDKLFVKATKLLDEGMTPEEAVNKVIGDTSHDETGE